MPSASKPRVLSSGTLDPEDPASPKPLSPFHLALPDPNPGIQAASPSKCPEVWTPQGRHPQALFFLVFGTSEVCRAEVALGHLFSGDSRPQHRQCFLLMLERTRNILGVHSAIHACHLDSIDVIKTHPRASSHKQRSRSNSPRIQRRAADVTTT